MVMVSPTISIMILPTILQLINCLPRTDLSQEMVNFIRYNQKLALAIGRINFLVDCRHHGILPTFIVNKTHQIAKDGYKYRHISLQVSRLQKSLLNEEIREAFRRKAFLQRCLTRSASCLRESCPRWMWLHQQGKLVLNDELRTVSKRLSKKLRGLLNQQGDSPSLSGGVPAASVNLHHMPDLNLTSSQTGLKKTISDSKHQLSVHASRSFLKICADVVHGLITHSCRAYRWVQCLLVNSARFASSLRESRPRWIELHKQTSVPTTLANAQTVHLDLAPSQAGPQKAISGPTFQQRTLRSLLEIGADMIQGLKSCCARASRGLQFSPVNWTRLASILRDPVLHFVRLQQQQQPANAPTSFGVLQRLKSHLSGTYRWVQCSLGKWIVRIIKLGKPGVPQDDTGD